MHFAPFNIVPLADVPPPSEEVEAAQLAAVEAAKPKVGLGISSFSNCTPTNLK